MYIQVEILGENAEELSIVVDSKASESMQRYLSVKVCSLNMESSDGMET